MIRVVLADDQDLVREGLRMIIDAEPDMLAIGEAATGRNALDLVRRESPDIVLMDIRMPELDGIAATRAIVAEGLPTKVLVLTTFDLDEYVYRAMRAGASGFMLKDAGRLRLIAGIRTVLAGDSLLAPSITRRLIEDFCRGPEPGQSKVAATLSERETQVVRLVARGMSNAEIATHLFLAEPTVKSHVARILAKLGLRDRLQIAVFAHESGMLRPAGRTDMNTP